MGNRFDKANWSAENTSIFCEICLEEKRAGNHSNGFITNWGYVNISEKYYNSTHLKHSRKQLKQMGSIEEALSVLAVPKRTHWSGTQC
jgi:lipid II:glycine glycyltransferase (peptidoglycan interpeptide bridge formation enzyme)